MLAKRRGKRPKKKPGTPLILPCCYSPRQAGGRDQHRAALEPPRGRAPCHPGAAQRPKRHRTGTPKHRSGSPALQTAHQTTQSSGEPPGTYSSPYPPLGSPWRPLLGESHPSDRAANEGPSGTQRVRSRGAAVEAAAGRRSRPSVPTGQDLYPVALLFFLFWSRCP
jgi:hypothetical protein